jgi:hypothetical protein
MLNINEIQTPTPNDQHRCEMYRLKELLMMAIKSEAKMARACAEYKRWLGDALIRIRQLEEGTKP